MSRHGPVPMAENDAFISIGDSIHLHEDASNSHIGVEGFTDFQLTLEPEATLADQHDFAQYAVFELMPQQMYTMAKRLRSFDAHPPDDSLERENRRRELIEEVRRERAHNESEVQSAAGREVRYGKILQLRHAVSGKLVCVSHLASQSNRDARRVDISGNDFAGEAAWFR
jgi:hypothetical protein